MKTFYVPIVLAFVGSAWLLSTKSKSVAVTDPAVSTLLIKSDQQQARFEQDKKDGLIPR